MAHKIPKITESSKFNVFTSIWIVPFIALIIAAWLAYEHFSNLGPEIKIIFPQNEGLVAGQSVVKFRNVPVGKVTNIYVEEGTEGVVVTVRMNSKEAGPYLTEYANFWIVKPEVGFSGVSGLDTLISGTYINAYSKAGGVHRKRRFMGLTQPFREGWDGEYFVLRSPSGGNVEVGMPVFYKNIKAGEVAYTYLSLDNQYMDMIVFIDQAYAAFVEEDSKFWLKSNINLDLTKGSLDVTIATVKHFVQGGITFSSTGKHRTGKIDEQHVFYLYKNQIQAQSKRFGSEFGKKEPFFMELKEDFSNLKRGSIVRFDGYTIGEVSEVNMGYDPASHAIVGEALLEIDTTVFCSGAEQNSSTNFMRAVTEGLRAELGVLNPLSGVQYINLTFDHSEGNGTVMIKGSKAYLPTLTHAKKDIMGSVTALLEKLNKLPLEQLLISVQKVVDRSAAPLQSANVLLMDLQKTVDNLNVLTGQNAFKKLPKTLSSTIEEIQRTLRSTRKLIKGYGNNSLAQQQLAQTLEVLGRTSQEMQLFLRMLNRKPNSLIFGDD